MMNTARQLRRVWIYYCWNRVRLSFRQANSIQFGKQSRRYTTKQQTPISSPKAGRNHTIMLALSSVLDLQNRSSTLILKTKTKGALSCTEL